QQHGVRVLGEELLALERQEVLDQRGDRDEALGDVVGGAAHETTRSPTVSAASPTVTSLGWTPGSPGGGPLVSATACTSSAIEPQCSASAASSSPAVPCTHTATRAS